MTFNSEVNAMQNIDTGKWVVFRLEWDERSIYPRRIEIANDLEREEVDKWLAWGNLQK